MFLSSNDLFFLPEFFTKAATVLTICYCYDMLRSLFSKACICSTVPEDQGFQPSASQISPQLISHQGTENISSSRLLATYKGAQRVRYASALKERVLSIAAKMRAGQGVQNLISFSSPAQPAEPFLVRQLLNFAQYVCLLRQRHRLLCTSASYVVSCWFRLSTYRKPLSIALTKQQLWEIGQCSAESCRNVPQHSISANSQEAFTCIIFRNNQNYDQI